MQLLTKKIEEPVRGLSYADLNYLVYSSEAEELRHSGGARGAYIIPRRGPLAYCGLMGVTAVLDDHRSTLTEASLLQSPVARNMFEGDWLLKYFADRLKDMPALSKVRNWLESLRSEIYQGPSSLRAYYVAETTKRLCTATWAIIDKAEIALLGAATARIRAMGTSSVSVQTKRELDKHIKKRQRFRSRVSVVGEIAESPQEANADHDVVGLFELVWKGPGRDVRVRGSWDHWKKDLALEPCPSGHFKATLALPKKDYECKFIVDGQWAASDGMEKTACANQNNVMRPQGMAYVPISIDPEER